MTNHPNRSKREVAMMLRERAKELRANASGREAYTAGIMIDQAEFMERQADRLDSKRRNPMCDGDKCRHDTGEVRVYPLGGGANLILCADCWRHENAHWPAINWDAAKIYPGEP